MNANLIIWVVVILIAAIVALYFDNRHGEPGKTQMSPRKNDAKKEYDKLTKIWSKGMYGWMWIGQEFRPIRVYGSKNGKIKVRPLHSYEKNDDPLWTVDPKYIYVTEAIPGDYARLWREHCWHMEHDEDDQRAREWYEQMKSERPSDNK